MVKRRQAANGQPAVGTVDINTVPEMHNESAARLVEETEDVERVVNK